MADRLQHQGISKAIFKDLYESYKSVGVRYITVHANINIGGYTWAKYGFYADNMENALRAISNGESTMPQQYEEARQIIEDFYKDKDEYTMFPMRLIADKPWGQRLLLGSNWHGTIDLQDAKQRKKWEKYIG